MDNLISGAIAVIIFMSFVLGLAHSIGQLPFALIVVFVCILLCIDYFQSARQGLQEERQKKSRAAD
jgi:uncharacterized membrane protein